MRIPRVHGVARPIAAAAGIAFALDLALDPPDHLGDVLGRILIFPVVVLLAFLVGRWLGQRTWPKRGRRLGAALLRKAGGDARVLFLSDRPDFRASHWRRVWDVVGFAAGASVILTAILVFAGVGQTSLNAVSTLLVLVMMWFAFLLVPYWAFAQLGLRQVDPVRWLVLPMGKRYADRMKLSNGTLLVLGVGAALNVGYRAGAAQEQAFIDGVLTVARIVASVLVMAAAAVAYYEREEGKLLAALEQDALAAGIRDGRGMTDGEFLPRLPPVSKSEPS